MCPNVWTRVNHFSELMKKLKETERIEREMAVEGRNLENHIGKWGALLPTWDEGENDNNEVIIF